MARAFEARFRTRTRTSQQRQRNPDFDPQSYEWKFAWDGDEEAKFREWVGAEGRTEPFQQQIERARSASGSGRAAPMIRRGAANELERLEREMRQAYTSEVTEFRTEAARQRGRAAQTAPGSRGRRRAGREQRAAASGGIDGGFGGGIGTLLTGGTNLLERNRERRTSLLGRAR